jgi:hypothetical protein
VEVAVAALVFHQIPCCSAHPDKPPGHEIVFPKVIVNLRVQEHEATRGERRPPVSVARLCEKLLDGFLPGTETHFPQLLNPEASNAKDARDP